jgi:hypothetical protein
MNATDDPTQGTSTPTAEKARGCCGGPAPKDTDACCVLDAEVKATGGTGCGCGPRTTSSSSKKGCC